MERSSTPPGQPANTEATNTTGAGEAQGALPAAYRCDMCGTSPAEVVVTMIEGRDTIMYCLPCLAGQMLGAAEQQAAAS